MSTFFDILLLQGLGQAERFRGTDLSDYLTAQATLLASEPFRDKKAAHAEMEAAARRITEKRKELVKSTQEVNKELTELKKLIYVNGTSDGMFGALMGGVLHPYLTGYDNFRELAGWGMHDKFLVQLMSPTCPHCQTMLPQMENVLKELNIPLGLAYALDVSCMGGGVQCELSKFITKHFLETKLWDGFVPALFLGSLQGDHLKFEALLYNGLNDLRAKVAAAMRYEADSALGTASAVTSLQQLATVQQKMAADANSAFVDAQADDLAQRQRQLKSMVKKLHQNDPIGHSLGELVDQLDTTDAKSFQTLLNSRLAKVLDKYYGSPMKPDVYASKL